MALVKFPECGHEVSSDAQTCPNCGKPVDATAQNSYPESKQKERNNKSTTIQSSKTAVPYMKRSTQKQNQATGLFHCCPQW